MSRTSRRYGWKPDLPDKRDFKFQAPEPILANLPASVDLRRFCPPVYTQGDLGSCTANAIAGAIEFALMQQNGVQFMPSRLFIYYNERVIESTVNSDSGAYLRDGLNSVSQQGVCSETEWPYNIGEFEKKPFQSCYQDALQDIISQYSSLSQNIYQMKSCLAAGYPFVFGFTVYSSFENPQVGQTGIVNMPDINNESVVGGHAVVAVGYDDSQNRFIVRNSYGESWGMNGYFTMPYAYLLDPGLASDFWTVRLVGDNS